MTYDEWQQQHAEQQEDRMVNWKAERAADAKQRREAKKLARRPVVVAMRRLRCPECRSVNVKTVRTLDNDDAILSRRQKCQSCGLAFTTIYD